MKYRMILFTSVLAALVLLVGQPVAAQTEVASNQDGDTEAIDGIEYTHRFVEAGGLVWHYVEAGEGEPIVFLHGMPEAWYTWHYQMAGLATDHHVIALDLKGFGQSDKADGDYSSPAVAEEIAALLDAVGLEQFTLVARDQGATSADYLAMNHPDHIARYVRIDTSFRMFGAFPGGQGGAFPGPQGGAGGGEGGAPPAIEPGATPGAGPGGERGAPPAIEPGATPGADRPGSPGGGPGMGDAMQDADTFVRSMLDRQTVQDIPEADIARLVAEFSREGVAEAASRYYRDMFAPGGDPSEEDRPVVDYTVMNFPVLLLQGDFAQQQEVDEEQIGDFIAQFPNAAFYWVIDAGQFSHLEQPEVVTDTIRAFLEAPAA